MPTRKYLSPHSLRPLYQQHGQQSACLHRAITPTPTDTTKSSASHVHVQRVMKMQVMPNQNPIPTKTEATKDTRDPASRRTQEGRIERGHQTKVQQDSSSLPNPHANIENRASNPSKLDHTKTLADTNDRTKDAFPRTNRR
jgi:hypothetical protein